MVWPSLTNSPCTHRCPDVGLSVATRITSLLMAAAVGEILECWFENRPIREEYLIVQGGRLAGAGAHSYKPGDATAGSEQAARFKT